MKTRLSFSQDTYVITFYTTLPKDLPKHLALLWPLEYKIWLSLIMVFVIVALIQSLTSQSNDGIIEMVHLLGVLTNKGKNEL